MCSSDLSLPLSGVAQTCLREAGVSASAIECVASASRIATAARPTAGWCNAAVNVAVDAEVNAGKANPLDAAKQLRGGVTRSGHPPVGSLESWPDLSDEDYAMKCRMAWLGPTAVWLALLAVSALLPGRFASAQPSLAPANAPRPVSLVILSTLPESYARSQVRAFERANPGVRVDLIVQRPEQVLTALRSATPAQRAHLIWSASTESFTAAAADGLLLGAGGEPLAPGVTVPIDQGIAVRAQHMIRIALARRTGAGAPAWPERWQDLAQGECGARLVNPFATAGGAGGVLIEAALQDLG